MAKEAFEKQIAKEPKWIEEIYEHHDWRKNNNGEIDEWFLDVGYCNGPGCIRCGYSFCEHYDEKINSKCDCSHWECPTCNEKINKSNTRCGKCGQLLNWENIVENEWKKTKI